MRNRNKMSLAQAVSTLFENDVPEITLAVVKQRYRELAVKHHPDKGGDAKKFLEIKDAYDVVLANITDASQLYRPRTGQRASVTMDDIFVDFVTGRGESGTSPFNRYGKSTSPLYEVIQYAAKLGVAISVTMQGENFVVTHIADIALPTPIVLGSNVEAAKKAVDTIVKEQKEHKGRFKK